MKTLIVQREVVDLQTQGRSEQYAVVCPEPHPLTDRYSLTFEGYVTPWGDRDTAEAQQKQLKEVKS